MTRRNVQVKLIKNVTKRNVTYKKRKENLLKKVRELSVLCNIRVLQVCINQTGVIDTWPHNTQHILDIIARYQGLDLVHQDKCKGDLVSYLLHRMCKKISDPNVRNLANVKQKSSSFLDEVRKRIQYHTTNGDEGNSHDVEPVNKVESASCAQVKTTDIDSILRVEPVNYFGHQNVRYFYPYGPCRFWLPYPMNYDTMNVQMGGYIVPSVFQPQPIQMSSNNVETRGGEGEASNFKASSNYQLEQQ